MHILPVHSLMPGIVVLGQPRPAEALVRRNSLEFKGSNEHSLAKLDRVMLFPLLSAELSLPYDATCNAPVTHWADRPFWNHHKGTDQERHWSLAAKTTNGLVTPSAVMSMKTFETWKVLNGLQTPLQKQYFGATHLLLSCADRSHMDAKSPATFG